jgi:hypothetical protein
MSTLHCCCCGTCAPVAAVCGGHAVFTGCSSSLTTEKETSIGGGHAGAVLKVGRKGLCITTVLEHDRHALLRFWAKTVFMGYYSNLST